MSRRVARPGSTLRRELGPNDEHLVPIAQDVAIERGVLVCEACYHIAAIRSLHAARADAVRDTVRCVKAAVQDTTAQGGQQAAHLLPGQITVNERPVWTLAVAPPRPPLPPGRHDPHAHAARHARLVLAVERLQLTTEQAFAETNVLPAVFNRADSQAERMAAESPVRGLKALFGDVVQSLWRGARVDAARPLAIDRDAVVGALAAWFSAVSAVYRAASALKDARAVSGAGATANLEREARILAVYADSFRVATPARFVQSHAGWLDERYDAL